MHLALLQTLVKLTGNELRQSLQNPDIKVETLLDLSCFLRQTAHESVANYLSKTELSNTINVEILRRIQDLEQREKVAADALRNSFSAHMGLLRHAIQAKSVPQG